MQKPRFYISIIMLISFCVILLGTCFIVVAYAFENQYAGIFGSITVKEFSGKGTIDNPYNISNEKQLNNAVNYWRTYYDEPVYFRQVNNITITKDWNSGAAGNFFPFGLLDIFNQDDTSKYYPFSGGYDGGGYTISGLNIQNSAYSALFSMTESATLTNIHILESNFADGQMSAAIAAVAKDSIISRCSSNAEVVSENISAGIVASAGVSSDDESLNMIISESYNAGKVIGKTAAGIVNNIGPYTKISDVYNIGFINGTDWASGIGGNLVDKANASNLISLGRVVCSQQPGNAYGLFTNSLTSGRVQNAYFFADAAGQNFFPSNNVAGSIAKYDTQLRNRAEFTFTQASVWIAEMQPGSVFYPFVQLAANRHRYENKNDHYMHGDGTSSFPFLVVNSGTLRLTGNKNESIVSTIKPYLLSRSYILAEDVDLLGQEWTPVGSSTRNFTGTFSGNGKNILRLFIDRSDFDNVGFFGNLNNATVKDLNIKDAAVYGKNNSGIFAGAIAGSSVINNCMVLGSVSGGDNTGGFAGLVNRSAQIKKCFSGGSVAGLYCSGGFVGCVFGGAIVSECFSVSNIVNPTEDATEAGGFAGRNSGEIYDCYATGGVAARSHTGGFVGANYSIITRCYSIGKVDIFSNNGGFSGWNDGGTFTGCYWDTYTSGRTSSSGGTGRTTPQMYLPGTYTGWSPDIWILQNGSYPRLKNISLEAQVF